MTETDVREREQLRLDVLGLVFLALLCAFGGTCGCFGLLFCNGCGRLPTGSRQQIKDILIKEFKLCTSGILSGQ